MEGIRWELSHVKRIVRFTMAKTCRRVKGAIFNPSSPIKFCYAFNGESCSHNPYSYSHKCQLCSMSHARVNWRVRRQKQGTINTTKSPQNTHNLPVPSLVNPKRLSSFLINYDRVLSSYLIYGFTYDFKLGCTSDPPPSTPETINQHWNIRISLKTTYKQV